MADNKFNKQVPKPPSQNNDNAIETPFSQKQTTQKPQPTKTNQQQTIKVPQNKPVRVAQQQKQPPLQKPKPPSKKQANQQPLQQQNIQTNTSRKTKATVNPKPQTQTPNTIKTPTTKQPQKKPPKSPQTPTSRPTAKPEPNTPSKPTANQKTKKMGTTPPKAEPNQTKIQQKEQQQQTVKQTPTEPPPQTPPIKKPQAINGAKFINQRANSAGGLLKLLYIVLFIVAFGSGGYFLVKNVFLDQTHKAQGEILLQSPYHPVNWKGFGNVFEPLLEVPVVYPQQGVEDVTFLLDSGALVSSLPRDYAPKLGYDSMAKLQRSTFRGFGGTTSFAYKGEMEIVMGDTKETIPVVFTEAAGTKKILGRSGFFENFSIYFNSKKKVIEVRHK
jgi:hypothetical protein